MNMVFNKNLEGSDRRLLQLRGFRIALREDITDDQIELLSGSSETYDLIFLNLLKPGLRIVKLDGETMKPLAGARFRISAVGSAVKKEYTTDESGVIELTVTVSLAAEERETPSPSAVSGESSISSARAKAKKRYIPFIEYDASFGIHR